jgi:hypothetical protein
MFLAGNLMWVIQGVQSGSWILGALQIFPELTEKKSATGAGSQGTWRP